MVSADRLQIKQNQNILLGNSEGEIGGHPVLPPPRFQGDFTVENLPCRKQIGCVLMQKQREGTARSIWMKVKSGENDAEWAYEYTHQKSLAVV